MPMRDILHAMVPAFGAAAASSQAPTMRQILDNFRNERADDIAAMADRAGRSGARLAIATRQREEWKAYARNLERLCLAAGIAMPAAPDERPDS